MTKFALVSASAVAIVAATAAPAFAQAIQNGAIKSQTVIFDNTVTSNGGTVTLDTLSGLGYGSSWARSGYTITSNGGNRSINGSYLPTRLNDAGAAVGGQSITIDPYSPAPSSGLTFTFDNPINAFGLEIGDWATCCYLPSSLYISFDGGATRLVASAYSSSDNPGWVAGDAYRNFIGAFDSSSTFSTVSFYGDGFGEILYAGGTIRYGTVDIGSVPEPGAVPEPATWAMMIIGFGAVGGVMRRRRGEKLTVRYA